jgi:hypothetical protein
MGTAGNHAWVLQRLIVELCSVSKTLCHGPAASYPENELPLKPRAIELQSIHNLQHMQCTAARTYTHIRTHSTHTHAHTKHKHKHKDVFKHTHTPHKTHHTQCFCHHWSSGAPTRRLVGCADTCAHTHKHTNTYTQTHKHKRTFNLCGTQRRSRGAPRQCTSGCAQTY